MIQFGCCIWEKWRNTEECGAERPTGARHAGSDGQKRSVGAAMNADTRPGARPRTPLAAAMLIPSPWTRPPIQAGRPGLATVHPSTFWDLTVRTRLSTFGSLFSRTKSRPRPMWLPGSGHVQEQKRLPPRLADESNRSLPGSRQNGGFGCMRACVCAGSLHKRHGPQAHP